MIRPGQLIGWRDSPICVNGRIPWAILTDHLPKPCPFQRTNTLAGTLNGFSPDPDGSKTDQPETAHVIHAQQTFSSIDGVDSTSAVYEAGMKGKATLSIH